MSATLLEIQRSVLLGYRRAQAVALRERRREQRFEPAFTQAVLGWWDGDHSRIRPAEVVNISRSGALLLADEAPGELERANLAFATDRQSRWLAGTVVGSALDASGRYLVRFKFEAECPDEIFDVLIGDADLAPQPPQHAADEAHKPEARDDARQLSLDFELIEPIEDGSAESTEFACYNVSSFVAENDLSC
jgi:hypothetical protein